MTDVPVVLFCFLPLTKQRNLHKHVWIGNAEHLTLVLFKDVIIIITKGISNTYMHMEKCRSVLAELCMCSY